LATVADAQGDVRMADTWRERMAERTSDPAAAWIALAQQAMNRGEHDLAEGRWTQAAASGNSVAVWEQAAIAAVTMKAWIYAYAWWSYAIQAGADAVACWTSAARAATQQGEMGRAEEYWNRAATAAPDRADIWRTFGDMALDAGYPARAIKALRRLLAKLRLEYPQLRICLSGDSLFGCGEGFQIAKDYHCDYVYVFKAGRTPALWEDFQGLLSLCPAQRVELTTPKGVHQVYRWVNGLQYRDSVGRDWTLNAIQCKETDKNGKETTWAWLTSLEVNRETVQEVATQGGRERWRTENEGFNTQKNSDLNLEHAYSHHCWEAYYLLLQLAHMLLQLIEKGSLLQELAQQQGKQTAVALFGSLTAMAKRLLDSLRYWCWPDDAFDVAAARQIQIRLNSS
jgi:tetratricopeptide (TPR) repeat protein